MCFNAESVILQSNICECVLSLQMSSFRDRERTVTTDTKSSDINHMENISKAMNKAREYIILFLTFMFFKLTMALVILCQKFTWGVTGVDRIRKDAHRGLNFKQSAHVQSIFWRRKFYGMSMSDPSEFITTHKCFKHPNYVLKPNMSIYCMTKSEVFFVEVKADTNIYGGPDSSAKFHTEQFQKAINLISMPLASFHKIASDLGAPKMPIIWISSTGRCGASLLSHVFAQLPGMMVLNEPDVLTSLAFLRKTNKINKGEYEQLLPSSIRLLCKPDERAGMICIKARGCCTRQIQLVFKNFPQVIQIFIYRNSLKTVSSGLGLFAVEPIAIAIRHIIDNKILSTVMPCFRNTLYRYFCMISDREPPMTSLKSLSSTGIFTTSWAANVSLCVEAVEQRVPILPVLYEDMLKNPRRTCALLFDFLDIRKEYISAAMEGFKVDTNKGNMSSLVISDSRRTIPHEFRVEADLILKKYNLPKLGERFEIPSLIDFDASANKFTRMNSKDKFF